MPWEDRTPAEQAALDYCLPKGIAPSVLWGRIVGHGEPEWTHEDRQALFDWLTKEASRCTDCGADLGECMEVANRWAYTAEALWCHGCRAIHRESVRLSGPGAKESPLAGTRYRFKRTPKDRDNGHVELVE